MNTKLIIEKADNRIREINWTISQLENEKKLLEEIQRSASLGFEDVTQDFMNEYRKLFKRDN